LSPGCGTELKWWDCLATVHPERGFLAHDLGAGTAQDPVDRRPVDLDLDHPGVQVLGKVLADQPTLFALDLEQLLLDLALSLDVLEQLLDPIHAAASYQKGVSMFGCGTKRFLEPLLRGV